MKLTELNRPFIVAVITDENVDNCIRTMKLAESDGAEAFELNLHAQEPFPPSKNDLKDIIGCTRKPVFTTNRRTHYWARMLGAEQNQQTSERTRNRWQRYLTRKAQTEEERIKLQIDAFEAGATGFDMELDTFDPCMDWDGAKLKKNMELLKGISLDADVLPREISHDATAEKRQVGIIDDIHSRGGEIMVSAHVLARMPPEGALRVGMLMEKRGADLAKIVARNNDLNDLVDTLRCNLLLKKKLKIPFKMMSMGQPSRIGRIIYPMFGTSWVYCQQTFVPGGFHHQPLVTTMRDILQKVDFNMEVTY